MKGQVARRYLGRPSLRHSVALEAARLLYHREYKEYFQAKREAAKRHGCKILPTNQEIHRLILQIAEASEGPTRTLRLRQMREAARETMKLLSAFKPRLIGSVWTGHIRQGSDIDLHLYGDDLEAMLQCLDEARWCYSVRRVQTRAKGKEQEFVHIGHRHSAGFDVEMTVYSEEQYREHPTCSITGGPMARATLPELNRLLAETKSETTSARMVREVSDEKLQQLIVGETGSRPLLKLLPEVTACLGVVQNGYHHLDVFDHTLAVVDRLKRLKEERFAPFAQREALQEHFSDELWHGWQRFPLLLLAAYCHDIGKPYTASLSGSGRIRFLGHDSEGARLTRSLASRLDVGVEIASALELIVLRHMTCVLLPSGDIYPSALHTFFRQAGIFAPELLLLSWADVHSARGPEQSPLRFEEQDSFVDEMLEEYFTRGELRFPVVPVSAVDLEMEFGLTDHRLRERLLERLTCDYLDREFEGREDGLSWASELLDGSAELW